MMIKKWYHDRGNTISVCIVGFAYSENFKFKQKIIMD